MKFRRFGWLIVLTMTGCGAVDQSEPGPAGDSSPANDVDDFKARHTPQAVAGDDALRRELADLVAREQGFPSRWTDAQFEAQLATHAALGAALSAQQQAAWSALHALSATSAVVSWQPDGTPAYIDTGLSFRGATGREARADVARRIGPLLRDMFAQSDDELVQREDQPYEVDVGFDAGGPMKAHRFRYDRVVSGLPVFGDWYTETLQTAEGDPTSWSLTIAARWTPNLPASTTPSLGSAQAVAAAAASGEVAGGAPAGEPRLGFHRSGDSVELAYEVFLQGADASWLYYVSANSGAILEKHSQIAENHITGGVTIPVRRPYETTPVARGVPFANVYENYAVELGSPLCGSASGAENQWMGETISRKGWTDSSGFYSNLTDWNPSDVNWTIDLKGSSIQDTSPYYDILDFDTFPAGGWHAFSEDLNWARNRRAGAYYLLNYAYSVYASYAVPQYPLLKFEFYHSLNPDTHSIHSDCSAPTIGAGCCRGQAKAGCVYLECAMGPTGAALAERRFREVTFHEHNHTLRFMASGSLCGQCSLSPSVDGPECNCFEEGRADFGAISLGRFEKSRPEFHPNRKYPADMSLPPAAPPYGAASIWSSIYTHYMLVGGPRMIGAVNLNLNQVDTATRMVGDCTSATDWATCPVNSFYRQLIANDQAVTLPRWRNTEEISAVFHAHVTDASRLTAGVQAFPWADETPNRYLSPPFVYTELTPGTGHYLVTQGAFGGGTLAINNADDHDTVMFFARTGESYTVATDNLATGVDTQIEVYKVTGGSTATVAFNDDCAPPLRHSCVTFTAADNDLYRITVNRYPGTGIGPAATYRLYVDTTDDFGDSLATATAVSPDNLVHSPHGRFNTGSDVDVFSVPVASAPQNLTYLGCSTAGAFDVKVELLNPSNTVVDSFTRTSCSSQRTFSATTKGLWKLRVSSPSAATGDYGLRVGLAASDIDVNNTIANAWNLSGTGMLGSRFETTTDGDWYKISATSGRYYSVETIGLDTGVNTKLEVYAPISTLYKLSFTGSLPDTSGGQGLGHWMLSDSNGGLRGNDSRINFWAPIDGTYYVRVVQEGTPTAGRYLLVFHDNAGVTEPYPAYP